MDFPQRLKLCQRERHMTNDAFAKYIGKSRTWLQSIYTNNRNITKYLLSERTIYDLNELLGIPTKVMEDYNIYISRMRNEIGDR